MKGNKKKIAIISAILVVVIAVAVAVVIMLTKKDKKEEYRVVKIDSYEGTVELEREQEKVEIFEGIKLSVNDMVTTGNDGLTELLVDSDKHLLAKEDTCFSIEATGDETNGKVTIDLEYGTALIEIENKLEDGSEFNVNTPNASLSVRGTTFEVTYNKDAGETIVSVTDGVVEVVAAGETREVNAGETVIIKDDTIEGSAAPVEDDGSGDGSSEETTEEEVKEHDSSTDDFAHTEDIMATLVSGDGDSLSIKQIEGFEVNDSIFVDTDDRKYFINGAYYIDYCYSDVSALTAYNSTVDYFNSDLVKIDGKFENNEFINEDGDTVYYTQWLAVDGTESMGLFKEIDDNHCVTISVLNSTGAEGQWENPEEFLDLTKDCYYVIE